MISPRRIVRVFSDFEDGERSILNEDNGLLAPSVVEGYEVRLDRADRQLLGRYRDEDGIGNGRFEPSFVQLRLARVDAPPGGTPRTRWKAVRREIAVQPSGSAGGRHHPGHSGPGDRARTGPALGRSAGHHRGHRDP